MKNIAIIILCIILLLIYLNISVFENFETELTTENKTKLFPSLPPTHKPPPPAHDPNKNLSFCCSQDKLEINDLMANKFRSSNEYSEPFDLLIQNQEYRKNS